MTSEQISLSKIRIKSNARVIAANKWLERSILMLILVLLYMSYGALGRDVFYNPLMVRIGTDPNDPIGAVLPYVRIFLCIVTVFIVSAATSFNWAFSKVPWMLAPFCLFVIATAAWSDNPKDVLRNGIMTTTMWIALPMLIHRLGLVATTRVTLHVIAMVCIVSFFLAIFLPSIGRHTGLEATQSSHVGEWRGIFGHKNLLGPWAAWGSVFLFTHAWVGGKPRLYWWFAGGCAVTCLIFSHSSTSLITGILLWFIWIAFLMLRRLTLSAFFLSAGLPFIIAVIAVAIFKDDIFMALGKDSTLTGRTVIWAIDWEFIQDNPWFGHGFQMMGGDAFHARLFASLGQPLGPESAYFSILLDEGIIGAVLFFIPFYLSIKNGFEWMKHVILIDRACIEMLIMILLSALITGYTESQVLFSTGYDGVLSFTALFALLTTPKSPEGVMRGDFRLAKYRMLPLGNSSLSR